MADLNEITLQDTNGKSVTYVAKDSLNQKAEKFEGLECVLLRTYSAGVFVGYLASSKIESGIRTSVLKNSIRIHYWDGAASLSQLAMAAHSEGLTFAAPAARMTPYSRHSPRISFINAVLLLTIRVRIRCID